MSPQGWTVLTFAACLLGFTLVGALAARSRQETTEDYLLAGRNVSPWLAALSAVATNNSGYMFIGLIGYAYRAGFQAIWLQGAWIVGDYVAWRWVQRGVRRTSGAVSALSVSDWLGKRLVLRPGRAPEVQEHSPLTVRVTALLTFLFLGGYAAAQLKAGSVSMEVLFGWPSYGGAIIGAVIIVVYCFSGGMRASIWTDAAQSMVMFVSMSLLCVTGLHEAGGISGLEATLRSQSPDLVALAPASTLAGSLLFFCGFLFGGLGGVGQPHILSRIMSLRTADDIVRTRRYYFAWFIPFSFFALLVGLEARALLPDLLSPGATMGPEHALPLLSVDLLPPALVGLMLAGIFAATMSTADSQVLSCTAAITQDLFPRLRGSYRWTKGFTLLTAVLSLVIALVATQGVFDLVLLAWSVLGASIGPLVLVRAFDRMPSQALSLSMVATGLVTVAAWRASGLHQVLYEILPGMLVPLLVYFLATFAGGRPRRPSEDENVDFVPSAGRSER